MKGVLPRLGCWARSAGTTDFCPALPALVSPIQNIIYLTAHFFTLLVPAPSNLGRQSCWVAFLCVSGINSGTWGQARLHPHGRKPSVFTQEYTCVKFNHIKKPVSNRTPVYLKQKTI
jgi:hypothetical protein